MRTGYLPDSDEFLRVEDALLLITRFTEVAQAARTRTAPRFSREQNEQALRDAYENGAIALQDYESMRSGNPSKYVDSTRVRVTAAIKSSPLSAIAATLWISLGDFHRFAELREVQVRFSRDEFVKDYKFVIYDVENELGYTIQGAARALARDFGISAGAIRQRIFDAAEQEKLRVTDPQTGMVYVPRVRSFHHERISVFELNRWLEENDVPYRLSDNPADPVTATVLTNRPHIDRKRVMHIFKVRPKPDQNRIFWDDRLARPPSWLIGARIVKGKRGVSSRWDPLLVAHALLDREHMTLPKLDLAIRENLPSLFAEWEEQTHADRHEDEMPED